MVEGSKWYAGLLGVCLFFGGGCATTDDPSVQIEWNKLKAWSADTSYKATRIFRDDDYRAETLGSVNSWFGDVAEGLNAKSIEQIAAYAGEARQITVWANQYEALAPYGAWLAARLDYYEAAQEAVASVPEPAPRPQPPPKAIILPPPKPKGTITVRGAQPALPPPRPQHAPPQVTVPPVAVEQQRIETATRSDTWRKKVTKHQMPVRATELVPKLKPIFRAEQVPEHLVWIAEVESTFNPEARSPAGAVGLYQLMPATARALGLTTANPDQRLDPESNARAAARYLRQLHKRFGSWPLVFAAYNCGEGRVARVVKQTQGRRYEDIAAHLPLETRMYVPRVQETIRLRAGIAPENM